MSVSTPKLCVSCEFVHGMVFIQERGEATKRTSKFLVQVRGALGFPFTTIFGPMIVEPGDFFPIKT